jgi:hypothetical protein
MFSFFKKKPKIQEILETRTQCIHSKVSMLHLKSGDSLIIEMPMRNLPPKKLQEYSDSLKATLRSSAMFDGVELFFFFHDNCEPISFIQLRREQENPGESK